MQSDNESTQSDYDAMMDNTIKNTIEEQEGKSMASPVEIPVKINYEVTEEFEDTRIWLLTPILSLLKSRKFVVSVITVIVNMIVAYSPEAEGMRGEMMTVFTAIGLWLTAMIAAEDIANMRS